MRPRASLAPAALAFRCVHAVIAGGFLVAIGYVWWCALTGTRGRALRIAVMALVAEGVLVSANHGDCPLGCLQGRVGDPVPLFQLALSPDAARHAVPVLGVVAAAGIGLLARPANGGLAQDGVPPAGFRTPMLKTTDAGVHRQL
jgi:hypothetical protein